MSDALTDIERDRRRNGMISAYLEKLIIYLEKPSKNNYKALKDVARGADCIPRGYFNGRTSFEENLESLLSRLRERDEIEWAGLLSSFSPLIKEGELYQRFENLSPFKGKKVMRVSYGNGFFINTDEIADVLISSELRKRCYGTHNYQKYFVIIPKRD